MAAIDLHTPLRQVVLLGCIMLCVPGMFNAVTSMAGGIDDPAVASQATAVLYVMFALVSLLAPVPTNTIGPRATCCIGTFGYIAYLLSLWLFNLGHVSPAVVVVAAAANGVGAALLFTAGGVILFALPSPETRGRLISLYMIIFSFGPVCGGLAAFGLNWSSAASQASSSTYAAFLALMCCGAALCSLLAPLATVVRADGTPAAAAASGPPPRLADEFRGLWHACLDKRLLALAPLFVASQWFYAWQFTCYNARLFNARTQGLNNSIYWLAQMAGSFASGRCFDSEWLRASRARVAAASIGVAVISGVTWALALGVTRARALDDDDGGDDGARLDFTSSGWPGLALLFAFFGWSDAWVQARVQLARLRVLCVALTAPRPSLCAQIFSSWLLPFLESSPRRLARVTAFNRSTYATGAAASWALSTASWGCGGACRGAVPPSAQAWVNLALTAASVPGTLWLIWRMDFRAPPHKGEGGTGADALAVDAALARVSLLGAAQDAEARTRCM
jgi:MFS family permease